MKTVKQRLLDSLEQSTASGRAIANYMLANLNELPFETAASIATKVGVGEMSVGRFCRSIGYIHFKELKADLKGNIGDSPWLVGDRLREFAARAQSGNDQLASSLEFEISTMVRVYEIAQSPEFERFVKRLATRETVYCAGFQTERGVASILAHQLQYLRDGVHLVDQAAGNFVDVLITDPSKIMLVIIAAQARGIPVTIITDTFCDWGPSVASEVFAVPTELNHFWDSLGPLVSLVQLAINGVFGQLGASVEDRLSQIFTCYNTFTGYVGTPQED